MRNMSFSLTTAQVRDRSKTVTRRLGWKNLKAGDRLQACEKCMGRRHGEPLVKLAVIEVVSVRRERLSALLDDPEYGRAEVAAEGFGSYEHPIPQYGPHATATSEQWFVKFFCSTHKGCETSDYITRIEFKYESDTQHQTQPQVYE